MNFQTIMEYLLYFGVLKEEIDAVAASVKSHAVGDTFDVTFAFPPSTGEKIAGHKVGMNTMTLNVTLKA